MTVSDATGAGRIRVVLPDEESLRDAIDRLEQEALPARVIEVRSSVPLSEDLAELAPTRRSRAPSWGIAGGIAGGVAGWLLALFTAKAYPIVTGHMPIVAAPTSGIVIYEGIALGAVLATTFCVLREGGLLRWRRREAQPHQDEPPAAGAIVVTLETDGVLASRVAAIFAEGGWPMGVGNGGGSRKNTTSASDR